MPEIIAAAIQQISTLNVWGVGVIIIGAIVVVGGFFGNLNNILDFPEKIRARIKPNKGGADKTSADPAVERIGAIRDGVLTPEQAIALAYAEAGERFENAPQSAETLPTGAEPADTFVRKFVSLATSKDKREREAAALDAEGRTEEALTLLAELAEEEAAQAAERWKARGAIAFNAFTAKSIESYERAVGCTPDDAEAHNQLGHLYQRTGDLVGAQSAYKKVLALGNKVADKIMLSVALGNLGIVELIRGNFDAATEYHQRSLAIDEKLGYKEGIADDYGNLGLVECYRGNLNTAVDYFEKALAINQELGRKVGVAKTFGNLGVVEDKRGDLEAAAEYYLQSLAIYRDLAQWDGMAISYGNLGVVERKRGHLNAAIDYYKQALAINKKLDHKEGIAANYDNLGIVEQFRDNPEGASDFWRKSYDLYTEIGASHMVEKVGGWLHDAGAEGFEKE